MFNPDETDWFPHSEKPSIALCIFKEILPHLSVAFSSDLQKALNFEGRDLTDDEAYRHLLDKYDINQDEFFKKLHSEEYKEKAHYEFALMKQLQVDGYPAVFIQTDDSKFYLIAKGYTDYEPLKMRVEQVLQ